MENQKAEQQGYLLEARNIYKSFSTVPALTNVDFNLRRGEVMALMGENGAGKSTLIKIITGLYTKDSGQVLLEGKEIRARSVLESQQMGIQSVFQELNLSPFLSVAENLFIGHEIRNKRGLIDWKKTNEEAKRILEEMSIYIDVKKPLKDLTAAVQQMVAIARAVAVNAKVLILDEATSSLDADEVEVLFTEIRRLKTKGIGIIYITHRMNEVFTISDRITVLRNGHLIGVYESAAIDMSRLISSMIGDAKGREVVVRKKENPELGNAPVLYSLRNINKKNRLYNVDLDIKSGEIVGLAGLLGSGRTELARIMFGDDQDFTGERYFKGEQVNLKTPAASIKNGIAYCTEERRSEGIFALMGVDDNIIMPSMDSYVRFGVIERKKKNAVVKEYIGRLAVKTPSSSMEIRKLSGGNQQKALVARWLCMDTKLIIFDEPTRGIDVGAKAEIEKLIQELAEQGLAVLYISSEFEELVRGCDRVIVLYEGHVVSELTGMDISNESITNAIAEGGRTVRDAEKLQEEKGV